MNNKKTNDISLAAYTGLLKTQFKTGDMDSAAVMVENIKAILLDGKSNRLLETDYHYFTLYTANLLLPVKDKKMYEYLLYYPLTVPGTGFA